MIKKENEKIIKIITNLLSDIGVVAQAKTEIVEDESKPRNHDLKVGELDTSLRVSPLKTHSDERNVVVRGENELVKIQMESEEAATLIGFHGETLQAIKLVLSFLIHKELKRWIKIDLNIGDYNQKREEQLKKLSLNLAMKAKFSGEVQSIPNLNSSERRLVHLFLSEHPDVYSESEGDGRNRCLMIKPKPKK